MESHAVKYSIKKNVLNESINNQAIITVHRRPVISLKRSKFHKLSSNIEVFMTTYTRLKKIHVAVIHSYHDKLPLNSAFFF